ncbi:TRAP transporter substrate-binding protein DctP [Actinomadura rugatobispora]|uniref:TRAP transporter substrate-binding protein DctP n=1 Tax=Actinomadura rugatobispora TaxID=1994 RepID=A0ABW1AB83_9ACTN|nr:TRAP transporter substrate-binding protein DctP [Actinomadura rugatobispora]
MSLRSITASLLCLALAATGCGGNGGGRGDGTITLRVAESFPQKHVIARTLSQRFMQNVEKASGGRIEFDYFPGEQLGKAADLIDVVKGGVADIGYMAPQYASESMPLGGVIGLPGIYPDAASGAPAYYALVTGRLYQEEIRKDEVFPLFSFVTGEYQVVTAGKRVTTPAGMHGLRVRTTSGYMEMTAKEFRAVPVSMAAPEMYQAMERGTIDSAMISAESIRPYGLDDILRYITTNLSLGGFGGFYAINDDTWRKLPPDLRRIMVEEGRKVSIDSGRVLTEDKKQVLRDFEKKGITLTTVAAEEKAKFDRVSGEIQRSWARDMNGRGLPGDDILAELRRLVRDGG